MEPIETVETPAAAAPPARPQILSGATSPESAHVDPDYPYGFRLRCARRAWIETTKHGQRFVTQTSNPKRGGIWNAPKAGTYSPIVVLYLDPVTGYVEHHGIGHYTRPEAIAGAIERFGPGAFCDEYRRAQLRGIVILQRASAIRYSTGDERAKSLAKLDALEPLINGLASFAAGPPLRPFQVDDTIRRVCDPAAGTFPIK